MMLHTLIQHTTNHGITIGYLILSVSDFYIQIYPKTCQIEKPQLKITQRNYSSCTWQS